MEIDEELNIAEEAEAVVEEIQIFDEEETEETNNANPPRRASGLVKLLLPCGRAKPGPPVGPALSRVGVNIDDFLQEFNERTKNNVGEWAAAYIYVYTDHSYTLQLKSQAPSTIMIKNK